MGDSKSTLLRMWVVAPNLADVGRSKWYGRAYGSPKLGSVGALYPWIWALCGNMSLPSSVIMPNLVAVSETLRAQVSSMQNLGLTDSSFRGHSGSPTVTQFDWLHYILVVLCNSEPLSNTLSEINGDICRKCKFFAHGLF